MSTDSSLPPICIPYTYSLMGRKLNLNHLTEAECEHILEVVHKDFNIRYLEKERLRQIEEDVQEEETKYTILSKSRIFNERNCICCFSRFLILFNPRILCDFCKFRVCKKCIHVDEETKKRCCQACLKNRQLKKQSNDWFYSSVEKRFKRCGSAKVIRSLYKRRLVEGGATLLKSFTSQIDVECDCERSSPCHIHSATHSTVNDELIHSFPKSHDDDRPSGGSSSEEFQEEGEADTSPSPDFPTGSGMQSYSFQEQSDRAETPLRADTSIQTECEKELAEAETMTTEEEASRCLSGFDGMATVSTEGHELDPHFITRPHNVRILEGEPLAVECKVNGTEPLDVLWFCNRNQVQQLQESDRCEIRRHGNSFSLTLFEISSPDSLEYLCIAVNALGQCAQGFTVTVDENTHERKSPEFSNPSDIEIVPEGSKAVLRCCVSAYPEPKVTWYKNNKHLLSHGERYRMERHRPDALNYSLIIENVRGEDSGTYSAVARNVAGEARHSIQLLVQPNVSESNVQSIAYPSSLSSTDICNSEDDIMRLAKGVSRTQGRYKTTASRMLRSADAMSSMQSQLDEMDRALQGLEGEVLEVISNEEDDDDDDDEDDANNNCRILDDLDDMESSAEAVGVVTSAALQLLSSAKELAQKTLGDDKKEQDKELEEDEDTDVEDEGEADDEDAEDYVDAADLCLSYQELEKLFHVGLITRSQLKNRLVQRRNIKYIRNYLQSAITGSLTDTASIASGNQSEESTMADAMDISVDSIEYTRNDDVHDARKNKNKSSRSRQEVMQNDSSKGQIMELAAETENLLKKAEQQIYMTSGKVFSLEDYISDLERQVLDVDENTSTEKLATLENNVARAVANVTQSDQEVNEIERQIEQWMKNSNRNTRAAVTTASSSNRNSPIPEV